MKFLRDRFWEFSMWSMRSMDSLFGLFETVAGDVRDQENIEILKQNWSGSFWPNPKGDNAQI